MSLEQLVNLTKCPTCDTMVPVGRLRPDKPRKCERCANKEKYERRKIMLKLRNLKIKKCHGCHGEVKRLGVFCSDYCEWMCNMRRTHHNKIILSIKDLK